MYIRLLAAQSCGFGERQLSINAVYRQLIFQYILFVGYAQWLGPKASLRPGDCRAVSKVLTITIREVHASTTAVRAL